MWFLFQIIDLNYCIYRPVKRSLSSLSHSSTSGTDPGLLGNSIELVVHIQKEGFVIFVNSHFCVFFAHRRDPENYSTLLLSLPVLDDNGNKEKAVYNKVWWGITDPSLPFHEIPASVIALANTYVHFFSKFFILKITSGPFFSIGAALWSYNYFLSFRSTFMSQISFLICLYHRQRFFNYQIRTLSFVSLLLHFIFYMCFLNFS